eukprot:TRINITY_DN62507_c0_g1_i1.p1 TRINITY_DN62507_c0_g1~~TRINITY_DN62507_c0_g1_i1.p1  ORF type:complete len:261 (+),score=44.53 TRINITY_DN62507_c0_g1_i1:61-843(+)
MASRPRGFGLTAELNNKKATKWDEASAADAAGWIEAVLGSKLLGSISDSETFREKLKDGTILCKVANALGANIKINQSKMAFAQMENIGKFLGWLSSIGVANMDQFQTVDLYEGTNMPQVIQCLHALGRKAFKLKLTSVTIGPKEAFSNKREFTDEQLRAGEGIIGLQMGINQGASEAGQNFGNAMQIIDRHDVSETPAMLSRQLVGSTTVSFGFAALSVLVVGFGVRRLLRGRRPQSSLLSDATRVAQSDLLEESESED